MQPHVVVQLTAAVPMGVVFSTIRSCTRPSAISALSACLQPRAWLRSDLLLVGGTDDSGSLDAKMSANVADLLRGSSGSLSHMLHHQQAQQLQVLRSL